MLDKVVEFLNASKSYSDLQTGVNIVSNAANEQAVVKDLKIQSGVTGPYTIKVGSSIIATTTGGLLSGAELVGESTILKLFGPTMLLNKFLYCSSTQVYPVSLSESFFEGAQPKTSSSTIGTAIQGTVLTVTPIFMCFAANGDFYYADSSGQIYRRAGGITGAQTNQAMDYAGMCYDGARYIYSFASATSIRVLDTTTNTVTTVAISTITTMTAATCTACAMDGYIWVKGANAETGKLINATTGTWVAAGGLTAASAVKYNCAMGKDSFGNYVVVWGDSTAPYQGYTILGKDLANISPVNGVFTGAAITDVLSGTGVGMSRVAENNRYIISIIATNAYLFDLDTKTMITIAGLTDTAAGPKFLYPDAARAASALGNVQVRATGIKTTL